MRPAASASTHALDIDHPQRSTSGAGLAKSLRLFCLSEFDSDRPCFSDEFVTPGFHCADRLLTQFLDAQLDCGSLVTRVETKGWHREELDENSRKQMLPGMLLHMVIAACPIDLALHSDL